MVEKKLGAAKNEEAQIGPVDSHVDLLRFWVNVAGESHGPACAEAWKNVRRLAHSLQLRAARHEVATVRPASKN